MANSAMTPTPPVSHPYNTHTSSMSAHNTPMSSEDHVPQLPAEATYNAIEEARDTNDPTRGTNNDRNVTYINNQTMSVTSDVSTEYLHPRVQCELAKLQALMQDLRDEKAELVSLKAELRNALLNIQSHPQSGPAPPPTNTYIIPARRTPAAGSTVAALGLVNNAPTTTLSSNTANNADATASDATANANNNINNPAPTRQPPMASIASVLDVLYILCRALDDQFNKVKSLCLDDHNNIQAVHEVFVSYLENEDLYVDTVRASLDRFASGGLAEYAKMRPTAVPSHRATTTQSQGQQQQGEEVGEDSGQHLRPPSSVSYGQ
ncbi:hypothetical protein M409DRAFT_28959 [Zasmidium cellare ATCC 36951]|uniref:Uncharacterized protein n=1 Tax=Zasmidium cellare ATCC 36951 TaxID=1080233 RepID=A0A6A6C0J6_ZASCE|nr:uncharacterized protein M409DRAFT_28959 [Zasmidium cellare ATCC 36951]KAF2160574.1 hypothetical protein M409DRAFT_28959 [Zasmidium cellare ATCC 36951]